MLDWPHLSSDRPQQGTDALGAQLNADHCLERLAALERSLRTEARGDALAPDLAALRGSIEAAAEALVTSQKELEGLRESEERWRSIAENPFDYVVLIDDKACFQYVNHTLPGTQPGDLVGKATIFQWTREEDHPAVQEALDEVFLQGKAAYYEAFSPPVQTWFGTIMGPIFRDGKVVAASVLARDITERKEALLAVRDSEERFRQLAENVEDVFFLVDPVAGRTLYTSPAYENLWGRSREALLHDMGAWLDGIHPDDRRRVEDTFRSMIRLFHGEKSGYEFRKPVEMRLLRPDGSVRWVRSRLFPVRDEAGHLRRVAGVVSDLTDRKLAEIKLAKAEERFRVLVETLPVIPYIAAPDEPRRTIYISPQIEAKLGFTQTEWLQTPDLWAARIHPEDRQRVIADVQLFLRSEANLSTRYRLLSRDGDELWFRDEAVLVCDAAGVPQSIQGVMLDVSEAEIARAEKQRARAMSARLVHVQEAERRHLARELHDEIGQQLTSLHFLLQTACECPGGDPPALDEARELLGDLMSRVRELSLELRPSLLDDLGLLPALISMFKHFTGRTGVEVQFDHEGLDGRFDPRLETAAYRIVQEALTNVARHAGVKEARVVSRCRDALLELQIHDEGQGFDPGSVGPDHGGLAGIQERVALLAGKLSVQAKPGDGTHLRIRIPLDGGSPIGLPGEIGGER